MEANIEAKDHVELLSGVVARAGVAAVVMDGGDQEVLVVVVVVVKNGGC